jgi:streptogramin lyase
MRDMRMAQVHRRGMILFLVLFIVFPVPAALAADSAPLIVQYPVPGSPFRVAVEQSGRIWVTLPAENAISRLVVTAPGVYDVKTYPLPTTVSEPYDIAVAAGAVWVTERSGNQIARLDLLTELWTEYPIPTDASQPTGLAVLLGDPVQVWFCEQAGNKLARLLIPAVGTSAFDEFPLPWTGAAMMESVAAVSSEAVWFTAPGRSILGRFQLSKWRPPDPTSPDPGGAFYAASTIIGSKPYEVRLGADDMPWVTEPVYNRIGHFMPGTLTLFEWFAIPTAASGLAGIDVSAGYVWFTERDGDRLGRLRKVDFVSQVNEFSLPGSHPMPTDIAVAGDGCTWSAASGTNQVIGWCPPYFRFSYLPISMKVQ